MATSPDRRPNTHRWTRALLVPTVVVAAVVVGPATASACACGAFLADERLEPKSETALVELTGDQQAVTLNVAAETEASEAAFLMPVPSEAEFDLADPKVFDELDDLSQPKIEYYDVEADRDGVGAPPGEDEVVVTDHVTVGPYDVAQLTGSSSDAVVSWLGDHDFELPIDLRDGLTPYLAEDWQIVAVQLTPDQVNGAGEPDEGEPDEGEPGTFADGLPSMRLSFATDTPVYPMRLSALAESSQPFRLYVLADQRMDISDPAPGGAAPSVTYANWVRPNALEDYPRVAELVEDRRFLTRYDATFQPENITDDITLTQAANNETYREVIREPRYVSPDGPGVGTYAVGAGTVAVLGVLAWLLIRTIRRRRDHA